MSPYRVPAEMPNTAVRARQHDYTLFGVIVVVGHFILACALLAIPFTLAVAYALVYLILSP